MSSAKFFAMIVDEFKNICKDTDRNGELVDLIKTFEKPQDAQRWVDRKLVDGAPNWYGEIYHGSSHWEDVFRNDSFARILKRPSSMASRKMASSVSRLSSSMKAKGDRFYFSKG